MMDSFGSHMQIDLSTEPEVGNDPPLEVKGNNKTGEGLDERVTT